MKITICGSLKFAKEMYNTYEILTKSGHEAVLPEFVIDFINGKLNYKLDNLSKEEDIEEKIKNDLIRKHYNRIKESDAVLIVNPEKNGIKNYIGANTFIEMSFAHVLNKKVFILNDLPEMNYIMDEIESMLPIILNGDLNKIN